MQRRIANSATFVSFTSTSTIEDSMQNQCGSRPGTIPGNGATLPPGGDHQQSSALLPRESWEIALSWLFRSKPYEHRLCRIRYMQSVDPLRWSGRHHSDWFCRPWTGKTSPHAPTLASNGLCRSGGDRVQLIRTCQQDWLTCWSLVQGKKPSQYFERVSFLK